MGCVHKDGEFSGPQRLLLLQASADGDSAPISIPRGHNRWQLTIAASAGVTGRIGLSFDAANVENPQQYIGGLRESVVFGTGGADITGTVGPLAARAKATLSALAGVGTVWAQLTTWREA